MPDRTAILIVSVWDAPGAQQRLRARLSAIDDVTQEQVRVGAAAGVDGITDAVRGWLTEWAAAAPGEGDAGGATRH